MDKDTASRIAALRRSRNFKSLIDELKESRSYHLARLLVQIKPEDAAFDRRISFEKGVLVGIDLVERTIRKAENVLEKNVQKQVRDNERK